MPDLTVGDLSPICNSWKCMVIWLCKWWAGSDV